MIDFKAKVGIVTGIRGTRVGRRVFVRFDYEHLKEEEEAQVIFGFSAVADRIEKASAGPVNIFVQDVRFNPCDYQKEGLACAAAGWAAQQFGFEPPEIRVDFDKEARQYNFEFKPSPVPAKKE